jgi:hypothetical protein
MRDNPELRARVEKPMDRVSLAGLDVPTTKTQQPGQVLDKTGRAVA